MMRNALHGRSAMIWVVLALSTAALAQERYCPATISVKQEIQQVPAGWRALPGKPPYQLAGITFYEGPPEQMASLAPDSETKSANTWHFEPSPEGIWIACSYASTDIVVAKQLPKEISQCVISYDRQLATAGLPEIRRVDCKASSASAKSSTPATPTKK